MFLDMKSYGPRPEPSPSQPPKPRLTRGEEKFLAWAIGFNLLFMLLAPICGSSVVDALVAVFSR